MCIAALNGSAVGVGITMTLGMDIRVAAKDAKIGEFYFFFVLSFKCFFILFFSSNFGHENNFFITLYV